ncbi:hypothetical protein BZG36_00794 [Bifiguratus adelaidae]|uniref:Uncharacterized protein n=1 Tax=Bifiguratus adelaidae TaxID=1938954 RepID=A0A261Y6P1_9FUNG|nr:hypothetical protein BZG36_00794 [Bifiguratus adelaidae]
MENTVRTAFSNIPAVTRSLFLALTLCSAVGWILQWTAWRDQGPLEPDTDGDEIAMLYHKVPLMGLVPGYAFRYPWTLVTSTFYENNPVTYITSALSILLCGKYLERAWGGRELVTFIAVVALLSTMVTWISYFAQFVVTRNEEYLQVYRMALYNVQSNGLAAVQVGFLVAFKQLIPEHVVNVFGGRISVRVKHLPGAFATATLISLVIFRTQTTYLLVGAGLYIAWLYLRFFQLQPDGSGVRGDRSEVFGLVGFFPDILR